jgi:methyl-accepting chemotaxis protein
MQETIRSIATAGAQQFEAADIEILREKNDWQRPEWKKVVTQLEKIRKANSDITFAYIFRKDPQDEHAFQFVSDSHSINPFANTDEDPSNDIDANKDGIIGAEDVLQWPGQEYPTPPKEAWQGFKGPSASSNFYTDTWGTYVSGYAPIVDKNRNVIAVLAVDMSARILRERVIESLKPLLVFIVFFVVFVIVRFAAFNRSMWHELWKIITANKKASPHQP